MVQMHKDNASDKASRPLGIEAKIEIDVWRLRYATAQKPGCT